MVIATMDTYTVIVQDIVTVFDDIYSPDKIDCSTLDDFTGSLKDSIIKVTRVLLKLAENFYHIVVARPAVLDSNVCVWKCETEKGSLIVVTIIAN